MHLMLQLYFTWCCSGAVLRHRSSVGSNCVNNTSKFKLSQRSSVDSRQFKLWQVGSDRQYNYSGRQSSGNNCPRSSHNDCPTGNFANSLANSSSRNLTLGINSGSSVDFDPECGSLAIVSFRHRIKPNNGAWLFASSFDLSYNQLLSLLD